MIKTNIDIRVLYAHTDKMGVVNNARYLEYFEAGRNDFLRKLNYPYTKLEDENTGLPVIEVYAKYISGAKYDEVLTIETTLNNIPTVRFRIDYRVISGERLVAEGYTVHSFVNFEKMKPVRPPDEFIKLIKSKFIS